MRKKSGFLLRFILVLSIIVFPLLYYSINIDTKKYVTDNEVQVATCNTNLTAENSQTTTCAITTTKYHTTSQLNTFTTSTVITTITEITSIKLPATTTIINTTPAISTKTLASYTYIFQTQPSISTTSNYTDLNNAIVFNNNYIIPVKICEMNQENVNQFDIILNNEFEKYNVAKSVCGHNTRSLRHLYETKVDDIITLIINGVPENYRVFLSEEVVLSSDSYDLLSLQDGSSLYVKYYNDSNVLRIFTCVNSIFQNRRWLVLGQKIS